MKTFFILCIASIFLTASAVFSQFNITSSIPADGAVNVPLSTTVSFTFSAPLDTTRLFGEFQLPVSIDVVDPPDSVDFGTISYSPDLKTMSVQVTHTPNTDFVWLIIDARDNTGQSLAQPYGLNYTTSPTHGANTVSGTITYEGGDPTNAFVGLIDQSLFGEEDGITLAGAIVPDASGKYIANYVRDGVYWPVAAKDIDGDGEVDPMGVDAIAYYDPDQDGEPDSIVVSGGNLTGIDMALSRLFEPVTASVYLEAAIDMAGEYAPDQELRGIGVHADPQEIDVDLDGTAFMWVYQFYSPSLQFPTMVLMSSFMTTADTTHAGFPSTGKPIPENFVDSDIAMAMADANGGHDFEESHDIVRRTIYGGNLWSELFLQDSTKIVWVVEYEALEPDSSLVFRVFVDMITGELATDVQEPAGSMPQSFALTQNYPNPFNPKTTLQFSISKQSFVTLTVYNILGKEIRTLVNEYKTAGTYKIDFDSKGLSSGVYYYKLSTDQFSQTRKMLILQ